MLCLFCFRISQVISYTKTFLDIMPYTHRPPSTPNKPYIRPIWWLWGKSNTSSQMTVLRCLCCVTLTDAVLFVSEDVQRLGVMIRHFR